MLVPTQQSGEYTVSVHPQRYLNLVRNIRNWPLHFAHKFGGNETQIFRFVTRRSGIEIEVPSSVYGIFKEMFMVGTYPLDDLARRLPQNPVIFDVGGNIGLFSVGLLDRIGPATVHIFEPMPGNLKVLERNTSACERITGAEFHVHRVAVVAPGKPPELPIYSASGGSADGSATLDPSRAGGRGETPQMVPATSINAVVDELGISRIDLLKIDCEGAEYEILPAIPEALLENTPNIVLEAHAGDSPDRAPEKMDAFLRSKGYDTRCIKGRRAWDIFAFRPSG